MFRKKKEQLDDRFYEGLNTGEANAYARINDIIDEYWNKQGVDHYGMLTAIKIICEYELRDNPYRRDVILFKKSEKKI